MKEYQPREIELDATMVAFLEEMAQKYALPDSGKAMRCLINYARENPGKLDDIFSEIRCIEC
jgi:hypothetical protein